MVQGFRAVQSCIAEQPQYWGRGWDDNALQAAWHCSPMSVLQGHPWLGPAATPGPLCVGIPLEMIALVAAEQASRHSVADEEMKTQWQGSGIGTTHSGGT
jgi:hypothetical protein